MPLLLLVSLYNILIRFSSFFRLRASYGERKHVMNVVCISEASEYWNAPPTPSLPVTKTDGACCNRAFRRFKTGDASRPPTAETVTSPSFSIFGQFSGFGQQFLVTSTRVGTDRRKTEGDSRKGTDQVGRKQSARLVLEGLVP